MTTRVHIVLGSPWKDAVIRHLEPRSPYRPWHTTGEVRENDRLIVVFDTEPRLVLTEVGRVGDNGSVDRAVARLRREWVLTDAVPASQLGVALPEAPALVVGSQADALVSAVEQERCRARGEDRFGLSTAPAARALLESRGRCTGCGKALPLTQPGARDAISAWTVEASSRDWPAALCVSCVTNMTAGHFGSFLDFKYFLHPPCPKCGQRRSRRMSFGMPVQPYDPPPWIAHQGCCVVDLNWVCARCGHQW